jgi:hypothetical protein
VRTAASAAVTLVLVAAAALAATATFVVLQDDDDPPRTPPTRSTIPVPDDEDHDAPLGGAVTDVIADRLLATLTERSGTQVTPAEARCLAEATVELLGLDRLIEAVRDDRPVATSPAEEAALLRVVITCVDPDRAAELLQIPTDTVPAVPLPGEDP